MDIFEARRANLLSLIAERFGGTQSAFASAIDRQSDYVSRLVHGHKGLGERLARHIEATLGLPSGWLDELHDEDSGLPPMPVDRDVVAVPVLAVTASMGRGRAQPDHDLVVDYMRITRSWLRAQLPTVSSPDQLAVLSAHGDSMRPTFDDGDLLLVDRGVQEVRVDAVYVLSLRGELFVKRVQRRITDGAWIVRSDNPLYDPIVVPDGDTPPLTVLGRVIWAWNGRRL
jgi:phage repressor protein C with HTH and peptisase S24 domain